MTASIGIFLDRDGTINEEIDFVTSPEDLHVLPGSAEAIRQARQLGLKVFVVTNQSAVARGLMTESQLDTVHRALTEELATFGATIDAIYYCPHHPELGVEPYRSDCDCRKPGTGMLMRAAREHNIDLQRSFVVGDRISDIQMGKSVGATTILVLTGYGTHEIEHPRDGAPTADFVADDLADAVELIKQIVSQKQSSVR
jgi:D-glycero-D-manno-heptose 1,7-bisphosphate phosphatase